MFPAKPSDWACQLTDTQIRKLELAQVCFAKRPETKHGAGATRQSCIGTALPRGTFTGMDGNLKLYALAILR